MPVADPPSGLIRPDPAPFQGGEGEGDSLTEPDRVDPPLAPPLQGGGQNGLSPATFNAAVLWAAAAYGEVAAALKRAEKAFAFDASVTPCIGFDLGQGETLYAAEIGLSDREAAAAIRGAAVQRLSAVKERLYALLTGPCGIAGVDLAALARHARGPALGGAGDDPATDPAGPEAQA